MEKKDKPILYLIPGQGADHRLFRDFHVESHDTVILDVPFPEKGELLPDLARRMAKEIDTSKPFSILGVSIGGMIAVEVAKFLSPKHLILVSSAKQRKELPPLYRMMRWIPLYKLFTGDQYKSLANVARRLFEPDAKEEDTLFRSMISAKDPRYMERTIHAIMHWQNETPPESCVHIHGDRDRTLPIRWIRNAQTVSSGSHMMILMNAKAVCKLVDEELNKSEYAS